MSTERELAAQLRLGILLVLQITFGVGGMVAMAAAPPPWIWLGFAFSIGATGCCALVLAFAPWSHPTPLRILAFLSAPASAYLLALWRAKAASGLGDRLAFHLCTGALSGAGMTALVMPAFCGGVVLAASIASGGVAGATLMTCWWALRR